MIKEVEIIKEVPIEVIKEVEVVKTFDMKNFEKLLGQMKTVESSRKVVGTTTTSGEATVVDRREVTGTTGTQITGKSMIGKSTKKMSSKSSSKSSSKEASKNGKGDDLTKIEGIGPKISQLLIKDGISTFSALSKSKFARIKKILVAAGPRYQMHDPTSWPQQAGLAADGKWKELKKLQDKLDGGK